MTKTLAIPMINLNDPDAAEQLAAAIGVKPGDTVRIVTPQFTRPASEGKAPPYPGDATFARLAGLSDAERRALGLRPWNKPGDGDAFGGGVLWLLPGEWYDYMPRRARLVSISGRAEAFDRGVTDNDTRFGCLAYGVVVGARKGWRAKVGGR